MYQPASLRPQGTQKEALTGMGQGSRKVRKLWAACRTPHTQGLGGGVQAYILFCLILFIYLFVGVHFENRLSVVLFPPMIMLSC